MFYLVLLFQKLMLGTISQSYVIGLNPLNWSESNTFCQEIGSDLASIHSETNFNESKEICVGHNGCWIGLNDNNMEGHWQWNDGTITDYGFINNNNTKPTTGQHPWSSNEANNNDNEDCVRLEGNTAFTWTDSSCDILQHPICNHPAQDTFSISINATENDTQNFTNQGKIIGISSWALWKTWKNKTWLHLDSTLCDFSWITEDDEDTSNKTVIGNGGGFDSWIDCDPFILDVNDYINGYRVIYGRFIFGLFFYTKNNKSYQCANIGKINNVNSYIDSGIILYKNQYLSGFIFDSGWVMNGIKLQFTPIITSLPTMPQTTTPPTNSPCTHLTTSTVSMIVEYSTTYITTTLSQFSLQSNLISVMNDNMEIAIIVIIIIIVLCCCICWLIYCVCCLYFNKRLTTQKAVKSQIKLAEIEIQPRLNISDRQKSGSVRGGYTSFEDDEDEKNFKQDIKPGINGQVEGMKIENKQQSTVSSDGHNNDLLNETRIPSGKVMVETMDDSDEMYDEKLKVEENETQTRTLTAIDENMNIQDATQHTSHSLDEMYDDPQENENV